jgi:ABC-type nitrate/sulfonate/bicarbonate transport system permease component
MRRTWRTPRRPSRVRADLAMRALLLPLIATGAVLGTWERLSLSGTLPAEVPPVSAIASWLWSNGGTSEIWTAVGQTLGHWAIALLAGVVLGAVVGGMMATSDVLNELLIATVEFFRPIPVVVYLPVMLLLFGATSGVVVALSAFAAVWPILLNTFYGVKDVDPVARDTARVFGLTRIQRLKWVTTPGVLPYFTTGVRIASTITLLVAIAMELLGAVPGLGNTLGTYATNGLYDATYSLLVIAGLLGVVLNAAFEQIERRILRWHVSYRPVIV